ncbi:MFS general substrate transporter [Penicillium herquei]|nr:MFS general substrate transporter [Penicillium herquei]
MEKVEDTYDSQRTIEEGFSSPNSTVTPDSSLSDASLRESNPKPDTAPSQLGPRTVTGIRWIGVCIPLYVSLFVYGLDATIAADVQSKVVEVFGRVDELSWIGFGFPLGSVSVICVCDTLYARFNMKWSYLGSTVLFAAGSALCGAAPNMASLIVGRVIAGAGGSGLYMGCLNLFTTFTTPQERGAYITGTGITWGLGAVLGPIIGGCFTDSSVTWRFSFYINLIIAAVFTPVTMICMPSFNPGAGTPLFTRLRRLDWVGFVLGAGTWVAFTMAFTMAGGQWPWNDGRTIATAVAFVVLWSLWGIQQTWCIFTTPEDRCLPVQLLRSRAQVLLYVATSSTITSLFIIVYYIPIYFQFVHGDSALDAAVRLLPYIVVTVLLNLGAGSLIARVKYYKAVYCVSAVFIILGGVLLTVYLKPDTNEGFIYGFTVLTAVGSGLTLQLGYAVASLKAPGHENGALCLQNIAQIGGSVIALVIAGQIYQTYARSGLTTALTSTGYSSADIQSIVAGAQSSLFEDLNTENKIVAIAAITTAMQKAFILVCVGGGTHLLSSVLMKPEKLVV